MYLLFGLVIFLIFLVVVLFIVGLSQQEMPGAEILYMLFTIVGAAVTFLLMLGGTIFVVMSLFG